MNYKTIRAFLCLCVCGFVAAGCDSKKDEPVEPEVIRHFDVSTSDITTTSVTLNIKRDEDKQFYYAIVRKAYFDSLGDDFQKVAADYLKGNIEAYVDFGYTREEAIAELCPKEDIVDYKEEWINGSTNYSIIVGYVTEDAEPTGDFERYEFRTASPEKSDNTFDVKITNIKSRSIDYSVTPSNDDPYTIVVVPNGEVSSYTDLDEMVGDLYGSLSWFDIYNGKYEGTVELKAGTQYAFLVFGITDNAATTALTKKVFTTLESGDPTKLTYKLDVSQGEVQGFELNFTVTPSDDTIDYFFELVNEDCTAEELLAYEEETIAKFYEFGLDRESYFSMFSSLGKDSRTYTIYPGERGKIGVIPIKSRTTEFACDPIFSKIITFPDAEQGEATIDISWDEYYDGAAIAELNPEYDYFGTNAVFPITVDCTGEKYFYNVFRYKEGESYSRDQIIYTLLSGTPSSYPSDCYAPFDADGIVYAVAIDEEGKCGPLLEKKFNFSKDGVSPAQDYLDKYGYGYSSVPSGKKASSDRKKAPKVYKKADVDLAPVPFHE